MKKLFAVSVLLCLVGVSNAKGRNLPDSEVGVGESLFETRGCAVCHHETDDQRRYDLGPSWKQIAAAYNSSDEDLKRFLKGKGEPIVDKADFPMMHGQIILLRTCSDSEIEALERFIVEQKLSPHRE
jgi:cytochrome c551/c552